MRILTIALGLLLSMTLTPVFVVAIDEGAMVGTVSTDPFERCRDLAGPDVVGEEPEYSARDLRRLQRRVDRALPALADQWVSGQGVNGVFVTVNVLTEEMVRTLAARFEGEPLCLDARDPEDLAAPGPQRQSGPGWELLGYVDDRRRTPQGIGVATEAVGYEKLWRSARMRGAAPAVDFSDHIVLLFGRSHGSTCTQLRLDDILVDTARALVYPLLVRPDNPLSCTADRAGYHRFMVAVDRDVLPVGPFGVGIPDPFAQAGPPSQPSVHVAVDLSEAGASAGPAHIAPVAYDPRIDALRSGATVESRGANDYVLDAACGIGHLGRINDIDWVSPTADIPPEWREATSDDGEILVTIRLRHRPGPRIRAEAGGHKVEYLPATAAPAPCEQ